MLLFDGLTMKSGVSWLFFDLSGICVCSFSTEYSIFSWKSSNIWHTDVFCTSFSPVGYLDG